MFVSPFKTPRRSISWNAASRNAGLTISPLLQATHESGRLVWHRRLAGEKREDAAGGVFCTRRLGDTKGIDPFLNP